MLKWRCDERSVPHSTPDISKRWPVYGHTWAVAHLTRGLRCARWPAPCVPLPRATTGRQVHACACLCQGTPLHGRPEPCGTCRSCTLMEHGSHPDFHTIAPMDGGDPPKVDRISGTLYVEQAEVTCTTCLRPFEGDTSSFTFRTRRRRPTASSTCCSRPLEEPPASTVICISATDRNAILPTILSRCQVLELHPLEHETVAEALRKAGRLLTSRLTSGPPGQWQARLGRRSSGARRPVGGTQAAA